MSALSEFFSRSSPRHEHDHHRPGTSERALAPVRVFGVYDGEDDRFVFGVRDFDEREKAERWARRMMEYHRRITSSEAWGEP